MVRLVSAVSVIGALLVQRRVVAADGRYEAFAIAVVECVIHRIDPDDVGAEEGPGAGRVIPEAEQEDLRLVFEEELAGEPEQQAELFAGSGYLPVRDSALDLDASRQVLAKYPSYQVAVDLYVETPSTPEKLGPRMGPFSQVRETVAQGIEEMVVGGKDPVQALDDAAQRATELLRDYNSRVGE